MPMKAAAAAVLLLSLLAGCAGYQVREGEPPRPFVSDGCSGRVWLTLTGAPGPWQDCCRAHDVPYWRGGTERERAAADAELLQCVAREGYPWVALAMFVGVRIGGHPALPTSWRWGFGWPYQILSPDPAWRDPAASFQILSP